jgi:hypothetical protein
LPLWELAQRAQVQLAWAPAHAKVLALVLAQVMTEWMKPQMLQRRVS